MAKNTYSRVRSTVRWRPEKNLPKEKGTMQANLYSLKRQKFNFLQTSFRLPWSPLNCKLHHSTNN